MGAAACHRREQYSAMRREPYSAMAAHKPAMQPGIVFPPKYKAKANERSTKPAHQTIPSILSSRF